MKNISQYILKLFSMRIENLEIVNTEFIPLQKTADIYNLS